MEILQKISFSILTGSMFYLIGIFIIHPYSPLIKLTEKYNINYEYILKIGNIILIAIWVIASVIIYILS